MIESHAVVLRLFKIATFTSPKCKKKIWSQNNFGKFSKNFPHVKSDL